jgi:cytochrome c oxidase assembly protein Cox11
VNESAQREGKRHGLRLVVVVVAMFGFGFALGPIYDAICKVTGINGKTSGMVADASALPVVDEGPGSSGSGLDGELHAGEHRVA